MSEHPDGTPAKLITDTKPLTVTDYAMFTIIDSLDADMKERLYGLLAPMTRSPAHLTVDDLVDASPGQSE